MKQITLKRNFALALAVAGMLAVGPAISADKSSWSGGDKGNKGGKSEHREKSNDRQDRNRNDDDRSSRDNGRSDGRSRQHFGDQHRTYAQQHYHSEFQRGHCPPGLAKKNNGCMPPGQARKWNVGRPLPRDVIFYDVPPALVLQFGQPPRGHRYVRVAGDILLIAIGSGMVIDAIQDLGRIR